MLARSKRISPPVDFMFPRHENCLMEEQEMKTTKLLFALKAFVLRVYCFIVKEFWKILALCLFGVMAWSMWKIGKTLVSIKYSLSGIDSTLLNIYWTLR